MIAAGYDPMALSRGIGKAAEAVCDEITKIATPISEKNKKELQQIATIAGNNDPAIGAVLADAFLKVGKDGVITIEEGKGNETTVEVVEGMQFDRGFLSPHFVTNQDNVSVELENCYVLLFEEKISHEQEDDPAARSDQQGQQAAADHCRRCRRGGSRDARRQQDARHPASLCRQGAGLRRSPQGDHGRHRRAD